MPPIMSPVICREGLLMRFEELVNQLSSGWKYHVSNTDGIKDSWKHFEKYFQSVCSYTSGKFYVFSFNFAAYFLLGRNALRFGVNCQNNKLAVSTFHLFSIAPKKVCSEQM